MIKPNRKKIRTNDYDKNSEQSKGGKKEEKGNRMN